MQHTTKRAHSQRTATKIETAIEDEVTFTRSTAVAFTRMQLPPNNYSNYNYYNYNLYNYNCFNYNYAHYDKSIKDNRISNSSTSSSCGGSNNQSNNRNFREPTTNYAATRKTTSASVSLTSASIALLPTTVGMLTALLLHLMLLTATTATTATSVTSARTTTTTVSTIIAATLAKAATATTATTTNSTAMVTAAMSAYFTSSNNNNNNNDLMYDITTTNYSMNVSNLTTTNAVGAAVNATAIDAVMSQQGVTATNGATAIGDINFNESDELSDGATEYIFDRTDVRIIFITLYTLVFCCCFFGNLLVILVVTLSRRLRSITNFFLANLALADFCVGLFCVMQNLSIYLIDSWVFGEFLCRMYQFVHSLSYTASIFILVVICMERYFAIVHPITCKQILTAARLRVVILTVWITSAVYSTPKFVFSKTIKNVHTEDGQEEEICVLDRKMYNSKLLDMINFVLLYAIPLLVMTVLYSKIAIALWRSSRGLSHHIAQRQDGGGGNGMGMHNSMYHHHGHHQHQQHQHNHQQQSSLQHTPLSLSQQQVPDTPIMGGGSGGGGGGSGVGSAVNSVGSMLSRKQSSKYEKRGVSITESQVSLESDRPIVSTCRSSGAGSNKGSFYHHHPHQRHGTQRGAASSHMSHSSSNVLRARRGVVRMLIIFVLTFALCNLPYHARKMWQYWSRSYRGDSNFNALLTPLTFLVSYFNSGVNPLLYAFLSRNFRKGMKELLLCSWKKGKGKSSSNSSMHHKRMALQTHSLPTDTTHIGNDQL